MSKNLFITLLFTTLLLGGCTTVTNFKLPDFNITSWQEEPVVPQGQTRPNYAWWQQFNDPVLTTLIKKATIQSPDIKIAAARIAQARAQEGGTLAEQLPNLGGATSASRQRLSQNKTNNVSGKKYNTNYLTNFDASWEVNPFGVGPVLRASQAFTQRRTEDYNQALVTLQGDVARTYFTIRQLQSQIVATEQNIKAQDEAVSLAAALNTAGKTSQVDLAQANALFATTSAALEPLTLTLKEQFYTLDVLLGQTPGVASAMVKGFATPTTIMPLKGLLASPARVIAERPDIRAAERELAYRAALKDAAFAQYYPKVSLSALFGFESATTGGLLQSASRAGTLSGGLIMPIFDFGRIRANVNEADANGQEALAVYEKTVLVALSEVEQALAAIAAEERNYSKLTKAVAANQLAITLAQERYRIGRDSYVNVLLSQQNFYTAKNAQAQSRGEILIQQVRLYKALGGGWHVNGSSIKAQD